MDKNALPQDLSANAQTVSGSSQVDAPISAAVAQVEGKPVVSLVKIKDDKVEAAVEEAIDLLGGIETVAWGKERIMLKPNLVGEGPSVTTKLVVVKTLAQLMQKAGKRVLIGEGSTAADGFNMKEGILYRTNNQELLDEMQQFIFDKLGYTELARSMDIPLINLHSGELVTVKVPHGLVYDEITLHRSLVEIDLLCSVPMMKTHVVSTVTLGMKNLMGLYPGTVYSCPRILVHDKAEPGSPGVAFEVIDMVRANKLGLVVIDGSMAMEGNGPSHGKVIKMDVIIAGTNPLATDMIAAGVMGFEPDEIPMFAWANKVGMPPHTLEEIEVRGQQLDSVRRNFVKPQVVPWRKIRGLWGVRETSKKLV